ncbi:vacuolar fusion protein ccz1 [Homalodisca vitripennis]|nr:vacuolar fusion protein ccz1 [Homalodisca vitripennis]
MPHIYYSTKEQSTLLCGIRLWGNFNAGNPSAETIVKTTSDYWVVGRLSNAREFYVVIQHKNANLIEISGESSSVISFLLYYL